MLLLLLVAVRPALAWDFGFDAAGRRYGLDPDLLRAVSWVESRHNPEALNINRDGSQDRGHMQINSRYWAANPWIFYSHVENDPQYCTMVGAWILASEIARWGDIWSGVAAYNTGAPPEKHSRPELREIALNYVAKVKARYKAIKAQGGKQWALK